MRLEKTAFLILLQLLTCSLIGQCGEGLSITLSTQSEVNSFIDNYCIEFEGNLEIKDDNNDQDNIVSLAPLLGLKRVNGVFQVSGNPFLENLSGLDSVSHIGAIRILNNSSITSLEGLNSFHSVYGDILISQNENLTTFDGLESLNTILSIGGYIQIAENNSLTDITALSSLSSFISGLIVKDNEELTSLNGLQNISINIDSDSPIAEDLEIVNNPVLNDCSIQSICEALNTEGVTFDIQNNGISCDSDNEIISNCTTPTITPKKTELKVSPNPVTDQIFIDSPHTTPLMVYNSIGILTRRIELKPGINSFDFSQLQNGMYFLKTPNGIIHQVIKL